MLIHFEDKTYEFEPGSIEVLEAIAIKSHTGHNLVDWEKAVQQMDALSVQALFWVVKQRNGEPCVLAELNFNMLAFITAYVAGLQAAAPVEVKTPKAGSGARKSRASTGT